MMLRAREEARSMGECKQLLYDARTIDHSLGFNLLADCICVNPLRKPRRGSERP